MTAYATVESAVAAIKAGAYDYLSKPFSLDQVEHAVERALELAGCVARFKDFGIPSRRDRF